MNERPIHFPQPTADAMIRAVLDGSKTQHRQPVKPSDPAWTYTIVDDGEDGTAWVYDVNEFGDYNRVCSPFGKPGDLLWMRECFAYGGGINGKPIVYRADWPELKRPCDSGQPYGGGFPDEKWSPSTNMPREACRITRLVKRVWVEEVQDITPEDAIAEGLIVYADGPLAPLYDHTRRDGLGFDCPVKCFRDLWDSIYAAKGYGWDANPPVWGCEFESTDEETQATTKGNS